MATTGAPLNITLMSLDGEITPNAEQKFNDAVIAINTGVAGVSTLKPRAHAYNNSNHVVLVSDGKLTNAGAMIQFHIDEDGEDITKQVKDFRICRSMSEPDHLELTLNRQGYHGPFCVLPSTQVSP